jgi:hypothetical protein
MRRCHGQEARTPVPAVPLRALRPTLLGVGRSAHWATAKYAEGTRSGCWAVGACRLTRPKRRQHPPTYRYARQKYAYRQPTLLVITALRVVSVDYIFLYYPTKLNGWTWAVSPGLRYLTWAPDGLTTVLGHVSDLFREDAPREVQVKRHRGPSVEYGHEHYEPKTGSSRLCHGFGSTPEQRTGSR